MKKTQFDLEAILVDKNTEDFMELPLTERVFDVFRVIAVFIIVLVCVKFIYIGLWEHSVYSKKAFANVNNFRIIKAERGIINDRFSKPLVLNEKSFFAFLSPKELPSNFKEQEEIFEKLSKILDTDSDKIREEVVKQSKYFDDYIILSSFLSDEQLVLLSSVSLKGVKIEQGFRRALTSPYVFSHVVGYTGFISKDEVGEYENLTPSDDIGKTGLEKYYDSYLRGKNGKEVFFSDSLGNVQDKKLINLPKTGNNINTYLDKEFQEYFYNRLNLELKNLGRKIGLGIAMNPQNGEVLALFSIPSFETTEVGKYLDDEDKPLFSRAIAGVYNPGSTIKPLVAIAALAEKIINPQKEIFSQGYIEIPNPYTPSQPSIFKDWKPHGWVNMHSAIARSSNVYFYAIGGGYKEQIGLGIKRLKKWWQKFNLDKKTNIDLPSEQVGFLPDPEWKKEHIQKNWLLGDTYNVTIGQGDLALTAIELLNYISAIANGGIFYQPRVVKQITGDNSKVLYESKPFVLQDISLEIAEFLPNVEQGMRDAVKEPYGTAYLLHNLPIQVAAKTGSAQIGDKTKFNALFAGYAPFYNVENKAIGQGEAQGKKPELAILVLIENAKEGSINTIPIAKDVFLWYYENRIKVKNN